MERRNLIKVGTSHAFIIPAKTLKRRGYDQQTTFEMLDTEEGILFRPIRSDAPTPLPRLKAAAPVSEALAELVGSVTITPEDLENDDRLAYLLSK